MPELTFHYAPTGEDDGVKLIAIALPSGRLLSKSEWHKVPHKFYVSGGDWKVIRVRWSKLVEVTLESDLWEFTDAGRIAVKGEITEKRLEKLQLGGGAVVVWKFYFKNAGEQVYCRKATCLWGLIDKYHPDQGWLYAWGPFECESGLLTKWSWPQLVEGALERWDITDNGEVVVEWDVRATSFLDESRSPCNYHHYSDKWLRRDLDYDWTMYLLRGLQSFMMAIACVNFMFLVSSVLDWLIYQ